MKVLYIVCMILGMMVMLLAARLIFLHRAVDGLCREFEERLRQDTNVGLRVSTSDRYVRRLAAKMDVQVRNLRRQELRFRQGNQELQTAITNMSHDLRTPLTAICGYLELLKREEMSKTAREYLLIVENRAAALKELMEELFRYSVIAAEDSGREEEISLNAALEECIAGYYGALKEKGIEPRIQMPEEPVKRILDGRALARVLSNIVSNAAKYSDGDLAVTLYENGEIVFKNHASGLDGLQAEHLSERFYTVRSGREATGLGLSIAKTLTEEMKGTLRTDYAEGCLRVTVKL